ncbi:MAG TPA: V-type ATP synthase subunit D [Candidatus Woesearchaeota archaeon]|jgi:V/A-type H+-transporting ATPase subunit D|nr:V-type ATP synthase subunit D [Candidatus Woesearchaeota archaeon]HJN56496.1 V-type ATP synthase subunit D [Candidatus Woesearchaeota archaeon]|tara:strand:- start:7489 stop:8106 length:618 start_codon:yes stop_codon:yes gene_type:complete
MAQDIKPTRSELLKVKKQIKLAQSGYSLLKKKRDGLILEFFEILKQAKTLREELVEQYKIALEKINVARVLEGDLKIKSIALAIKKIPEINLATRNIMGVKVPKIETSEIKKAFMERGYGVYSSAAIDEASEAYEKVVEKIILAAEIETSMRKLLNEIEKTKRRVNALEFKVIPSQNKIKSFIQLRLEEMERENIFRMKRIKAKA